MAGRPGRPGLGNHPRTWIGGVLVAFTGTWDVSGRGEGVDGLALESKDACNQYFVRGHAVQPSNNSAYLRRIVRPCPAKTSLFLASSLPMGGTCEFRGNFTMEIICKNPTSTIHRPFIKRCFPAASAARPRRRFQCCL